MINNKTERPKGSSWELGAAIKKYRDIAGLSQEKLANEFDISQPSVKAMESGRTVKGELKPPTYLPVKLREIVEFLRIPVTTPPLPPYAVKHLNPTPKPFSVSATKQVVDTAKHHSQGYGDLPLYFINGAAPESSPRGTFVISAQAVEYISRPVMVANVPLGYGLRVSDSTMDPAYRIGEVIFMHPHMPPVADKYVLLRTETNEQDGKKLAMIALLLSVTPTHWNIRKHNPPCDFSLSRDEWPVAHRIITQDRL